MEFCKATYSPHTQIPYAIFPGPISAINNHIVIDDISDLPSPKVMGHIEPSRAQFTNASTFDTTNSAAGLALAAFDVEN